MQVFTSLPPKLEGEIKCYLKLQISKVNWLKDKETPSNGSADKLNRLKPNANSRRSNFIIKCVWWGEKDTMGAIFRPKLVGSAQDPVKLQTTAKYMIRCGPKQFNAYLNGKSNQHCI